MAAAPADKCRRYSGPKATIRFTSDVADRSAEGRPKCQEARALTVDERLILEALTPGRMPWDGTAPIILEVPASISLLPLPPELNGQENIWQFMRQNWLSSRVFAGVDNIVDQPWKIISTAQRQWTVIG